MSDEFPSTFTAAAYALVDQEIAARANEVRAFCESPIELIFAVGFMMLCSKEYATVRYIEPKYDEASFGPILTGSNGVVVEFQKQIGPYRTDFLITRDRPGKPVGIVVECDGHAFHERTKEQAARDRSRDRELQSGGRRVFRFTGSEIYRNAFGCATEVISALVEMSFEDDVR